MVMVNQGILHQYQVRYRYLEYRGIFGDVPRDPGNRDLPIPQCTEDDTSKSWWMYNTLGLEVGRVHRDLRVNLESSLCHCLAPWFTGT